MVIPTVAYSFNKSIGGNLKLDKSNFGSNSPKSATNLAAKFSSTVLSTTCSSTTKFSSGAGLITGSFSLAFETSNGTFLVFKTGSFSNSEWLEMVGFKSFLLISNLEIGLRTISSRPASSSSHCICSLSSVANSSRLYPLEFSEIPVCRVLSSSKLTLADLSKKSLKSVGEILIL